MDSHTLHDVGRGNSGNKKTRRQAAEMICNATVFINSCATGGVVDLVFLVVARGRAGVAVSEIMKKKTIIEQKEKITFVLTNFS